MNQVSILSQEQIIPIYSGINQVFILTVQPLPGSAEVKPFALANDTELVIEEPENVESPQLDEKEEEQDTIKTFLSRRLPCPRNPFITSNLVHLINDDEFDSIKQECGVISPALIGSWRNDVVCIEVIDWQNNRVVELVLEKNELARNPKLLLNTQEFERNFIALNTKANKQRLQSQKKQFEHSLKWTPAGPSIPQIEEEKKTEDDKFQNQKRDPPILIKNSITGLIMEEITQEFLSQIWLFLKEAAQFKVKTLVLAKDNPTIDFGPFKLIFKLESLHSSIFEEINLWVAINLEGLMQLPYFSVNSSNYIPRYLIARSGQFESLPISDTKWIGKKVVKLRCTDDRDLGVLIEPCKDWLMTQQAVDVMVLDVSSFLAKQQWQAKSKSIVELLEDFALELQHRSLGGSLVVVMRNLNQLFKEEVGDEEKRTYRYVIASLQK